MQKVPDVLSSSGRTCAIYSFTRLVSNSILNSFTSFLCLGSRLRHFGHSSSSILRLEIPFGMLRVFLQFGNPEHATKRFPFVFARRTLILLLLHYGHVMNIVLSRALYVPTLPLFSPYALLF